MAERSITAALIIEEMRRELGMTEEQLLVHLAVEAVDTLSPRGQWNVVRKARAYHEQNIFMVNR